MATKQPHLFLAQQCLALAWYTEWKRNVIDLVIPQPQNWHYKSGPHHHVGSAWGMFGKVVEWVAEMEWKKDFLHMHWIGIIQVLDFPRKRSYETCSTLALVNMSVIIADTHSPIPETWETTQYPREQGTFKGQKKDRRKETEKKSCSY